MEPNHHDIIVYGIVASDHHKARWDLFLKFSNDIEILTGHFSVSVPPRSSTGWIALNDNSNAALAVQYLQRKPYYFNGHRLTFRLFENPVHNQIPSNTTAPVREQNRDSIETSSDVEKVTIDSEPTNAVQRVTEAIQTLRLEQSNRYHRVRTPSPKLTAEIGVQTDHQSAADGKCMVCHTPFYELPTDGLCLLPCGHPLCKACVAKIAYHNQFDEESLLMWTYPQTFQLCPVCRKRYTPASVVKCYI